jgi:hypothetical protein
LSAGVSLVLPHDGGDLRGDHAALGRQEHHGGADPMLLSRLTVREGWT